MKATGIVRRVDSLGRVVIPKEIRHTLRIKEGAPLEIYTDKDGALTFRKYSPLGELPDFAAHICESIRANTGAIAAVCDRDTILAVSGAPKRELQDRPLSRALEQRMEQRQTYHHQPGEPLLYPIDGYEKHHVAICAPIVSQGDLMGCVLLLAEPNADPLGETERKLAGTVAEFLGKQLEC